MYVADWIDLSEKASNPLDGVSWRTAMRPIQPDTDGMLIAHWATDKTSHPAPFWMYATLEAAASEWPAEWFELLQPAVLYTRPNKVLKHLENIVNEVLDYSDTLAAAGAERILSSAVARDDELTMVDDQALLAGSAATALRTRDFSATDEAVADAIGVKEAVVGRGAARLKATLPEGFRLVVVEPTWMPARAEHGTNAKPVPRDKIVRRTR